MGTAERCGPKIVNGLDYSKALNVFCLLGVAKDSHASIGTRATAAKDMVSDKLDENRHAVSSSF